MSVRSAVYIAFAIFVTFIPVTEALTCTVKSAPCVADSNVFTLSNQINAHAEKDTGLPYGWNVCCTDDLFPSDCYLNTAGLCPVDEVGLISLYAPTNSHAELYNSGSYSNHVCCPEPSNWDGVVCSLKPSCNGLFETAIISMSSSTNAHVGNTTAYPGNLLCCAMSDTTLPIVIANIPKFIMSPGEIKISLICIDGGSGCDVTHINTQHGSCTIYGSTGSCNISIDDCEYGNFQYNVNATDFAGNSNSSVIGIYDLKKSDGCECTYPEECISGTCINYEVCSLPKAPEIHFKTPSRSLVLLGESTTLLVNVRNMLDIGDSVKIDIYGNPSEIEYWMSFGDERKSTEFIDLDAGSNYSIPIILYGGKIGEYRLTVRAESASSGLQTYNRTTLSVIQMDKGGFTSETPDITSVGIIVVLFVAILLNYRKFTRLSTRYI